MRLIYIGRGCPILARLLRKGGTDDAGNEALQLVILPKMRQRSLASHTLHAPHARPHAAFSQNLDQPNLSGCSRRRSAATFPPEMSEPHSAQGKPDTSHDCQDEVGSRHVEPTYVAYLTARLRIERSAVEDNGAYVSRL